MAAGSRVSARGQLVKGTLCGAGLRRAASDGLVRESMDTAFMGLCSRLGNAYQRLFTCYRKSVYNLFLADFSKRITWAL
jgi:hypothetical protein